LRTTEQKRRPGKDLFWILAGFALMAAGDRGAGGTVQTRSAAD
jgi:hypothetical protein